MVVYKQNGSIWEGFTCPSFIRTCEDGRGRSRRWKWRRNKVETKYNLVYKQKLITHNHNSWIHLCHEDVDNQ
jgi:hypothetical protein